MIENIVADTSFYLCYYNDINKRDFLDIFLNTYSFHLGPKIFKELPSELSECSKFQSSTVFSEVSFFELIKPYFGRSKEHENDGEYEAIGVALHLNLHSNLKYLILDEKIAHNFVQSNFKSLTPKLKRNFSFIRDCYKIDSLISLSIAIEILETIKSCAEKAILEGNKHKRPCSTDIKVYNNILIPLIEELKAEYECS